MFINDALNNGNKYGYGICTDAGAMPSKTKIKLLPLMITTKYSGEASEDYRLNLFLKSMIPHDKASENAITTAENIINEMKSWPLASVASVYIADTASTETKTAELIRSGDARIEGKVFTRLMAFAGDPLHLLATSGQQSIKIIAGRKKTTKRQQEMDLCSYIAKSIYSWIVSNAKCHQKLLSYYPPNTISQFTAMSATRFLGVTTMADELFHTIEFLSTCQKASQPINFKIIISSSKNVLIF